MLMVYGSGNFFIHWDPTFIMPQNPECCILCILRNAFGGFATLYNIFSVDII